MSVTSKQYQLYTSAIFYGILLLTILVYWPGLNGDLILDDHENFASLSDLDNPSTSLGDIVFTNESGPLGRPVAMLTFAANYITSGNSTWALKYTNLMLHLACGSLVFWLSARLLLYSRFKNQRWEIALLTTSLWLLSPMLTTTTLYAVQRMTQLSCFFILSGLLSYTILRPKLDNKLKRYLLLILALISISLLLASLSKENGILLPFLVLLIELFFFKFSGSLKTKRVVTSAFFLTCFIPLVIGSIYLIYNPDFVTRGYNSRSFSLYERLITEPRILLDYLRNLILPNTSSLGVFHDDYQASNSILSPFTTLLSILFWTTIAAVSIHSVNKRHSIFFFGILFYLTGHLLESTIFALELYFEHRNYLPSFGIYFSLSLILVVISKKIKNKAVAITCLAMLPISFALASHQKAQTWSSWETLVYNSLTTHPNSLRAHTEAASIIASTNISEALSHIEIARSINPKQWAGLALHEILIYCASNTPIPINSYLNLTTNSPISRSAYSTTGLKVLRQIATQNKCPSLDINMLATSIEEWTTNPIYLPTKNMMWHFELELGMLYALNGNIEKTLKHLDLAIETKPDKIEPLLLKIKFAIEAGLIDDAEEALNHAKTIKIKRKDYIASLTGLETLIQIIRESRPQ